MATKVQRYSLWHMINHGGRAQIYTGSKSTDWYTRGGQAVIKCSQNLLWGLLCNKWIESDDRLSAILNAPATACYRITEVGIKAAGRKEPEIKAAYGAHGIRWK